MRPFLHLTAIFVILALAASPYRISAQSVNNVGTVTALGHDRPEFVCIDSELHEDCAERTAEKNGAAALLCYSISSTRSDSRPPFSLTAVPSIAFSPTRSLRCTTVDELQRPLVENMRITVLLQAPPGLWDYVENVGLTISSSALTAQDYGAVRGTTSQSQKSKAALPLSAGATLDEYCKQDNIFCFSRDSGVIELKGLWRLQSNTAPSISIAFVYSPMLIEDLKKLSASTTPKISDALSQEVLVALPPQPYPAVQPVYHFNVDTGLVWSSLKNPTYSRVETTAASGTSGSPGYAPAQYATQETPGTPQIFPVLFFTIYIPPRYLTNHITKHDWIPTADFGISLTSPGSDFFLGTSVEPLRKVQLIGGLHLGRINSLVKVPLDDPTSSAAPLTTTVFGYGAYVGAALNLDFIKSAFGK